MILSRYNLKKINLPGLQVPTAELFDLPEKVLQFGTGVLLRGLPDYFIDKANRQSKFNGRVIVVKSTDTGSTDEFDRQDGLYTLYVKGVENGKEVQKQIISSAISRVLSAANDWETILKTAHNPHLQVIISNTTEVGIQLVQDDITKHPPVSFPGKLLAILHERYKAFGGSEKSGFVIVPTELITDNGKKLEAIVLELAHLNKLDPAFMDWLESCNHFCNSLVDRIVPGRPSASQNDLLEQESGYEDTLRTIAEPYCLWAIEGDEKIASVLSFAEVDKGVVIAPDINKFRELKLRLLNGTHTLTCGIAYLSGFETVYQAMENEAFSQFLTQLMLSEISQAIPYEIDLTEAESFAYKVIDRFKNPFIEHRWLSIAMQYSSKLKMRVLPLLLNHYAQTSTVPDCFAFGFAAFIRFMRVVPNSTGKFTGNVNGQDYEIDDAQAELFYQAWKANDARTVATNILKNTVLWDTDLTQLPGFRDAVVRKLETIIYSGALRVLENMHIKSIAK